MLPIIISALTAAYVAQKKYDASRFNTEKNTLINKILQKSSDLQKEFDGFTKDKNFSIDDISAFKNPFDILAATRTDNLSMFGHALQYNYCNRLLTFYKLLEDYKVPIQAIQNFNLIDWLDHHINCYDDMATSLYFSNQDISYIRIANLIRTRDTCNEDEKASLEADIVACKDVIEFIEFFLPYYRAMIIKIAANPSKMDDQDDLSRHLRYLSLVITRKTDCLKTIFDTKTKIKELEEILPTQQADWQISRTTAMLARYRSKLALDTLELYFLLVLKKYFYVNQPHPIDLLERYKETFHKFEVLHETKFPIIFVKGTEVLNFEHKTFEIPPDLLEELQSLTIEFDLPIPDYDAILKKYAQPTGPVIIKVAEKSKKQAGPPLPPRPNKPKNNVLG